MKKILPLLILVNIFFTHLDGQIRRDPEQERLIQQAKELERVRRNLENLEMLSRKKYERIAPPIPYDFRHVLVEELYRSSYLSERELLSPSEDFRNKYFDLLKKNNTGMIRLVKDLGCDELSVKSQNPKICETFSMPGGGSAYSFRRKDHQIWKLADLLYDGKSLLSFGEMSIGFLVSVGNVSLDEVDKKTIGAGYVFSFVPKKDSVEVLKQNGQFVEGVNANGFLYKKYLPVAEGMTYILRSIAYQGEIFREYKGYRYNELDFDERKDVIVAFTIVESDFNGTITIIWRLLQSKKSPVLN